MTRLARLYFISLGVLLMLTFNAALAGPPPEAALRQRTLNFEGEWIEAVNKQPLDSLTQTGQNDKRNSPHLYKKKSDFAGEISNGLNQLRFIQP